MLSYHGGTKVLSYNIETSNKNIAMKIWAKITDYLDQEPVFVRSIYAGSLLEDFFVSAVGAVLAIRLYLMATGYGQLTFGLLHIAHLTWGGLFMLAGLMILLGTLNRRAEAVAAVVGGVGFGAFIDELGKFITKDNDYFFEPAIAVIYVIFVVIFLVIHTMRRRRPLSPEQSLANAFDLAMQGSLAGLDPEQKTQALELLDHCPPGPVRDNLTNIIRGTKTTAGRSSRWLDQARVYLDRIYNRASTQWWFSGMIVIIFTFTSVTSLYAVVGVVQWSLGVVLWVVTGLALLVGLMWSRRTRFRFLNIILSIGIVVVSTLISWAVLANLKHTPLSFVDFAQFIFPGVSGVLIILGLLTLTRSRLHGYLLFRLAILVSIFFTQVFAFYEQQLLALVGLLMNGIILLALRYLIAHEKGKLEIKSAAL
jgi:hypothetical protein